MEQRLDLVKELNMEDGTISVRESVLSEAGFTETEISDTRVLQGPLDELKASNLHTGPFRVQLTTFPHEHLTFTRDQGQRSVRLLDIASIFRIYPLQRSGLAR
jgi:hypothetical protein